MEALTIERTTRPEDLDRVAAIEAASFRNPWSREMLDRLLSHADVARVYVGRTSDGEIVAFCACWVVIDELHINTIAVKETHRRRGLGSSLMRTVMEEVAREGVTRATLEVRRSNEAARQLYHRLGFEERAVRPAYYTEPEEDALILWKDRL